MAVFKSLRNPYNGTALVIEDPCPGSSTMYIQNEGFDKNSLTPLHDVGLNLNATRGQISWYDVLGTNSSGFGVTQLHALTSSTTVPSVAHVSYVGTAATQETTFLNGILILNGETTTVRARLYNTVDSINNNLDTSPFISMDPDRRFCKPIQYFTDGEKNVVWGIYHINFSSSTRSAGDQPKYIYKINTDPFNFVSTPPQRNEGLTTPTGQVGQYQIWPAYRNPVTNNLIWAGQGSAIQTTNYLVPYSQRGISSGYWASPTPTWTSPTTSYSLNTTSQLLGISKIDSTAIFLNTDGATDNTIAVYKFIDANNVNTTLYSSPGTAPGAEGSSAGGAKGVSFGGWIAKYASSTFAESDTVTGWYQPYFDSNGQYVPIYYQWNRLFDSITRSGAVTFTYPGSNTLASYWLYDTQSSNQAPGAIYGMQRISANETFIWNGTRYLTFMNLHGAGGVYDGNTNQRTFVTYSVDSTNPKALTFHSTLVVPATPKNIVWLNDTRTILGIFTQFNFYIYVFNSTGWNLTSSLPYTFQAVGRDNYGRIWGQDVGPLGMARLHLISLTTPVSVVVTPGATTFQYTGIPIPSNVQINAYDTSGARMTTSVKLVINGGSMTFTNNNLATVVTTNNSSNTTVPIYVIGAGPSSIIATATV